MTNCRKTLLLERAGRIGLLLIVGLALWLAWAAAGGAYIVRAPAPIANGGRRAKIEFRDAPPLSAVLDTMRRREVFRQSVFYQTRKTEVADALGDLVFLGTSRANGSIRAFIRNTKTQQSSLYSAGDVLGDVLIKEIRPDCAVVSRGDVTVELK